jgi:hypothetical protein
VEAGFRKRSCSNKKLGRDDDSKKRHPALAHRRRGFYPFAIKDLLIDLLIAPVPVQHRRCQKWLP